MTMLNIRRAAASQNRWLVILAAFAGALSCSSDVAPDGGAVDAAADSTVDAAMDARAEAAAGDAGSDSQAHDSSSDVTITDAAPTDSSVTDATEGGAPDALAGNDGSSDALADAAAVDAVADTAPPSVQFTENVTELSRISAIAPPGAPNTAEIKPHSYFFVSGSTPINLYAPTQATLEQMAFYREQNISQYLLVFRVSATVTFRLDHIYNPVTAIVNAGPQNPSDNTMTSAPNSLVVIAAGGSIGTTTASVWDFGVYDTTITNTFANQARYVNNFMDNALHGVCPYNYFSSALKPTYEAKFGTATGTVFAGTACGNASRDAPGALAGMWFIDGVAGGVYPATFGIAKDSDGTVRVAGLSNMVLVASGTDPANVTGEICYGALNQYAYFRTVSATKIDVASAMGTCPGTFPQTGFRSYIR